MSQLKNLVAMILECCQSPRKHHASVYEKYATGKYKRASAFVEEEVHKGYILPFSSMSSRYTLSLDDNSTSAHYGPYETGIAIPTEG